jgi:phosphoserine phosphatase
MSDGAIPLAIIYDFDGTLAPGNMQERQFIPDVGMTAGEFWREVDALAEQNQADGILAYMFLMLEKAKEAGIPVRRDDLVARSRQIEFFPGVAGWFDRIDAYGDSKGVLVEHYVISSGNSEIIEGTSIAPKFSRIYASKFLYDAKGLAVWPAVAINFTTKTQYLFRINKGAHEWEDSSIINKFVPQSERPVPFENMIYIGDGETDVPCFRLVKDLGGLSIAVYADGARQRAEQYRVEGRVNCVVPAVYTESSGLDWTVRSYIDLVAARSTLNRALETGTDSE